MTIDRLLAGYSARVWLVLAVMLVMLMFLGARLHTLQVLRGEEHAEQISRQSVRNIRLPPVRGRIFSRDGVAFTDNTPRYDVLFHLHEMRQPGKRSLTLSDDYVLAQAVRVGAILGRPSDLTKQQVRDHRYRYGGILPLEVFHDLDEREHARLQEAMPQFPGLEIAARFDRSYPMGDVGAHFIGFVAKRPPAPGEFDFSRREFSGRTGLEAVYDSEMRGTGGIRQVLIDTAGYTHKTLREEPPANGQDVLLTIDSRAQKLAQSLLSGQRGAIVLMDVNTGAVLAMASSPTYDLSEISASYYSELTSDEDRPLQNRALIGHYTPGSIAKPLVAIGIMESGEATPETIINCPGYIEIGRARTRIRCWYHAGHGDLTMVDALQVSCNPFLISEGMETGIDRLSPIFESAGLGQATGVELRVPGDTGILPSRANMLERGNRNWSAADTAFVSIGQGFIGVSPLQAATYTAAIANGGFVMRPRLVNALRDQKGRLTYSYPETMRRLDASDETLALIREGMNRAVNGDRATADRAQTPTISLAGKTGTAQVKPVNGAPYNNTWFICFGPVENPRYAMAILIERGQSGGRTCAPIARRFFDAWLADRPRRLSQTQ